MQRIAQAGVILFAVFASALSTITRRNFVPEAPTVPAASKVKPIWEKHPFGLLKYKLAPTSDDDDDDDGPSTSKRLKTDEKRQKCEAVLISRRILLTSPGCGVTRKDSPCTFYTGADKKDYQVNVDKMIETSRGYKLLPLTKDVNSRATRIAFLSWVGDAESHDPRWSVQPKPNDGISYYLSTPFSYDQYSPTGKKRTEKELKWCTQVDRQDWIGLKCKNKAICDGSTVLNGATIFTTHVVGDSLKFNVHGLVSMRESGKFCKGGSKGVISGDSPRLTECSSNEHSYVCAKKISRADAAEILAAAKNVETLKMDTNFIPDGTIIGTFNMRGTGKFSGIAGIATTTTMRRMLKMADIFVLQEASSFHDLAKDTREEIQRGNVNKKHQEKIFIRKFSRDLGPTTVSQHVFLYNRENFTCDKCETVVKVRTKNGTISRADKCFFGKKVEKNGDADFVVYSVHLTPGTKAAKTRQQQWRKIVEDVKRNIHSFPRVIIAGDTNVGGGGDWKESRDDLSATVQILKDFSFPDPGATTVRQTDLSDDDGGAATAAAGETEKKKIKESRFDRFAISKSLRLMYRYYPPHGDKIVTTETAVIRNQSDRQKYYYYSLLREDRARTNEPEVQSLDLSDHLIIFFDDFENTDSRFKMCSWNMGRYDPTAETAVDSKSVKYAKYYADVLQECQVVAVQELMESKEKGSKTTTIEETLSDALPTPAPKKITVGYHEDKANNANWYWSLETPELGFRTKKGITIKSCLEIRLPDCWDKKKKQTRESRNAFSCTFKKAARDVVTLVSMHVLNDCSSMKKANEYITTIGKIHENRKTRTYVLGDFNMDYPGPRKANNAVCQHRHGNGLTYTKVDSLLTTDLIWKLSKGKDNPGVPSCQIINPDTYKINDRYVIPNRNPPRIKRVLNNWAGMSDHYPSYIQFEVPT